MSAPQQASLRNQLLAALPPEDFAALQPHLEPVDLILKQGVIEPNHPIEHVVFPEAGYISVAAVDGRSMVEVGIIGREGMAGLPVVLYARTSPFTYFVQHDGRGLRIATSRLEEIIDERPSVHRVLLRYAQAMSVQTSGTAFANAEHTVETRLARWLLMCHDRLDGDDIEITHEFMSMMLGVRRSGVTTATHVLEGNGLIRAKRGVITILDRDRLVEMADSAYGLPEAEYARLMAQGE
jgi:CRP-like cAMP-binding protein